MFDYTIKKKFGVKHTYIKIDKNGNITVSGGLLLTKKYAEKLLLSKKDWIETKLESILSENKDRDEITNGEVFYLYGFKYSINIEVNPLQRKSYKFVFENNKLMISSKKILSNEEIVTIRDEFYRFEIKNILPNMIDKISTRCNLHPNNITYRKAKTRWGSCAYNNNLSFSIYLVSLPKDLIEHIIMHELCHIVHKNHSKKFWNLLKSFRTNFETEKIKIKKLSKLV